MNNNTDVYYVTFKGNVAIVASSSDQAIEHAKKLGAFEVSAHVVPDDVERATELKHGLGHTKPFYACKPTTSDAANMTVAQLIKP